MPPPPSRTRALLLLGLLGAPAAQAWSNHTLGTREALSVLPAAREPVTVESLESYLRSQATALEALLDEEERWARRDLPGYPARPEALAFRAGGGAEGMRARFLAALRVNPEARLRLCVQAAPGEPETSAPRLAWSEVTLLHGGEVTRNTYLALAEGEPVAALEVVATAADEPDYGLDLGLWEDNGTAWGGQYGFGRQPFGNPALEFSSQAPFHMGFFHESAIVYAAAPFLRRTLPEHRIHLYRALARQAFGSGHRYWGWRFTGWALHYLQDLTQPYHARVLPGVSLARMLWVNTLDLVGVHRPKAEAVTLVSNRHLALENYQVRRMRAALEADRRDDALLRALRGEARAEEPPVPSASERAPRDLVAREAASSADATDRAVTRALPAHYTSDPGFTYDDARDPADLFAAADAAPPEARQALERSVADLLARFGAHTRSFVGGLGPTSTGQP
jgi:hypothetical protein